MLGTFFLLVVCLTNELIVFCKNVNIVESVIFKIVSVVRKNLLCFEVLKYFSHVLFYIIIVHFLRFKSLIFLKKCELWMPVYCLPDGYPVVLKHL